MSPQPAGSSSSADLAPGTLIAGFRLERVIGRGSRATVYEATQLSLDRRVALKVMDDRDLAERVRRLEWPEHPGAVSLFGAGDSEHGPWLAMRLLPGDTLETRAAPLDQVAAALDRAHAAGIVHGDVTARNVLVSGHHAYLSDFGLAPGEPTAEDDRVALEQLVRDHPPPRSRRRLAVLGAVAGTIAIAAIALGVVLTTGGGDGAAADAPPVPAGTKALGSDLAPGDIESVDCNGRPPSGMSRACSISQLALGGRAIVVPADGTITSWAVRGAGGSLALQVLRGRGRRLIQVDKSGEELITGPGPHLARTTLAVAAGDRVALLVPPGAAVGIRRGRGTVERWFGPLLEPARPPERPAGTGFDHELLLRVDISPKSGVDPIAPLRGAAAARAAAGRTLASRDVAVGGGEVRTVTVVSFGSAVAVDLFDAAQRVARVPVPRADGRGRLVSLTARARAARVRWRNPSGEELDDRVEVAAGGLS